jgi:D-arabinose 5-phosphate isomerase GutQ
MQSSEIIEKARQALTREAAAVAQQADLIDESFVEAASLLLDCKGHVLVCGMGTSGAMARRLAHLLTCSGTPALFISAADGLHGGSGAVKPDDVLIVISKGGRSDELNQFVSIVRSRGARVVALTEATDSPLAQQSDAIVRFRAPEGVDLHGMIATGTSLVNGAVGDALCIALLEMRGHTREAFGETHPGGAVGKKLAEGRT